MTVHCAFAWYVKQRSPTNSVKINRFILFII
jgi:hypothetical protein